MRFQDQINGWTLDESEIQANFDHDFENRLGLVGTDSQDLMSLLWDYDQDVYWDVVYAFEGALFRGEPVLGYERIDG